MVDRIRGSVLAVVGVAFALRLAALLVAVDVPLVLDEQTYHLRAQALLEGHGFVGSYQSWVHHEGRPVDLPQYPGAWQPPGQTAWLAAAMAVGGDSVFAARFGQVLLGTLAVWLVYQLGLAWYGHREGLAAAALCALYPNLIAFSTYLWSEPLFIVCLLGALVCLARPDRPPDTTAAVAAGVLLGLATLTRAAGLYMTPLLAGWLLWAHPLARPRAVRAGAIVVAVAALVIVPWSIRNTLLHDGLVLVETNASYNLWRGNGPDSFVARDAVSTPRYAWPFDGLPLAPVGNRNARRLVQEAKQALGDPAPDDLAIARYASAAAWGHIFDDPVGFLARVPIRLTDMWNPTSFLVRHLRLRAYGPLPALTDTLLSATAVLSYLAVLGLAGFGLWRTRDQPVSWLPVLVALLLSGMTAAAFGLTRFRLPVMPLLLLLAGAALVRARVPGRRVTAVAAALVAVLALGCGPSKPEGPNLLWVVWDTVRADRMSLYGHDRPTTPRLDTWAADARVFDDVVSPGGYTLPSHASMFTGLLPTEHCTYNGSTRLDDQYDTVAELLQRAGWRTFLFSANPQITASPTRNFAQGFDVAEHPWSPQWMERAIAITREKLDPRDQSSELVDRLAGGRQEITGWNVKAAGSLAQEATLDWLGRSDEDRPWFVFLNYMEAHRPLIPPQRYRELMLEGRDVARSYSVDRSWLATWEYTFGLRDFTKRELRITRATYDAALRELDDLFADLLAALDAAGELDDTIVVLTSDHGELLGEHHMLDHQYSLHEPVLRVPLVIHAPGRLAPGRETAPVSTVDLFHTVLELLGVSPPAKPPATPSLRSPSSQRVRLAEDPSSSTVGLSHVLDAHPGFDPTPFQRKQRALYDGPWKLLWGSDERHTLHHVERDPGEEHDASGEAPEELARLRATLDAAVARMQPCTPSGAAPAPTPEETRLLCALGYIDAGDPQCAE